MVYMVTSIPGRKTVISLVTSMPAESAMYLVTSIVSYLVTSIPLPGSHLPSNPCSREKNKRVIYLVTSISVRKYESVTQ